MNVICVDDESIILKRNISILGKLDQVTSVEGFTRPRDALEHLEKNQVDIIFADINMPDMNGLEMAEIIHQKWPDTALIFLTAYNEFAVEAFKVRATGYLVKPVEKEDFEEEINNVLSKMKPRSNKLAEVRTFGNFELLIDDKLVAFARSKSKEILAYLVCKNGTGVTRRELAAVLWEDAPYDYSKQKQLDVYIRSLIDTLKKNNIEEIVENGNGQLRVRPQLIDCDYYRYLAGDAQAISMYCDEFMDAYSWAEYMKSSFMK